MTKAEGLDPTTKAGLCELGNVFRQERVKREWSRQQVARRGGLERKQVERIEAGEPVRVFAYFRYAELLGLQVSLVTSKTKRELQAGHTASPVLSFTVIPEESDDMDRRTFISSVAAFFLDGSAPLSVRALLAGGERCPLKTVSEVEDLANECSEYLRKHSAFAGSGGSLGVALAMHSQATSWRDGRAIDAPVAEALEVLCCDLGAWVGKAARAAGNYRVAEQYLHETLTRARLIGLAEAETRALDGLARLWSHRERTDTALRHAQLGIKIAPTAKSRALMHFHTAVFSARLGDRAAFTLHSETARDLLAKDVGDSAPWLRFLTTGNQFLGLGHLALGNTHKVVQHCQADAADPKTYRSGVIHSRILTALALGNDGDFAEAAGLGLNMVPEVQTLSSQVVRKDLRALRDMVATGLPSHAFVSAYDELLLHA